MVFKVTALVNNETPVQLQLQMGGDDEGRAEGGRLISGGGGLGSSGQLEDDGDREGLGGVVL